jgi:hypothetical protein
MASLYTRQADRTRLAKEAMVKLSKGKTENIYSLTGNKSEGMTPKRPTRSRKCLSDGAAKRTRTSTGCPTSTSS